MFLPRYIVGNKIYQNRNVILYLRAVIEERKKPKQLVTASSNLFLHGDKL